MKINKGFTLIELLVVISIISFLSSILFSSLRFAQSKGIDAKKITESNQVKTALTNFYDDHQHMPGNYFNSNGTYNLNGTGDALALEDKINPTSPSNMAYEQSMNELVQNSYLGSIPRSPDNVPYGYFDYGTGSGQGAVFMTNLASTKTTSSCQITTLSLSGVNGPCSWTLYTYCGNISAANMNILTSGGNINNLSCYYSLGCRMNNGTTYFPALALQNHDSNIFSSIIPTAYAMVAAMWPLQCDLSGYNSSASTANASCAKYSLYGLDNTYTGTVNVPGSNFNFNQPVNLSPCVGGQAYCVCNPY